MTTRQQRNQYEAALRRLPEAYALALRLRANGESDAAICERLQIEAEGLAMFLEVADCKLQRELRNE